MEKFSQRITKTLFNKTPKKLSSEHFVDVKKLKLHKEIDRRKTFVQNDWFNEHVSFEELAQQGFYYFKKPNCVRCFFCQIDLNKFEPNDDLIKNHLKFSPNCPLLRRCKTSNKPVDQEDLDKILPPASYDVCGSVRKRSRIEEDIAYPQYLLPSIRLKSFDSWPHSSIQSPSNLCEAGFFYSEKFKGEIDATICFACGLVIVDWSSKDNPWVEHKRLLEKDCIHLKYNEAQLKMNEKIYNDSKKEKGLIDRQPKEQNETEADEENLCKICFSRKSSIVFLPCKHVAVCAQCVFGLKQKCPICRSNIEETITLLYA